MHFDRPANRRSEPALILLPTLGVGGSETKFVRLATALGEAGAPVHLAYFNPPTTLREEIGAQVPILDLERRGKYSLKSLRRLRDYIIDRNIRTLVAVNFYPLAYALPVRALRLPHRPRIIASINTTHITDRRERMFMTLYRPLLRRVDRVVYGCRQQEAHWGHAHGLEPARAAVIYNGVDCEHFDPRRDAPGVADCRRRHGIHDDAPVIVCVGQLRPEKAQRLLVEALARLQQRHGLAPHLLLVGDGPERESIERLASGLGLAQRVHLAGALADVRPCLRAADVFALSSLSETFSNAALEAGAMSLPVVMSDTGGAAEMFPDEQSGGVVYATGDIDALAASLAALLRDPPRCRRMGEQARRTVCGRFSREQMVADWRDTLWPVGGGPVGASGD
jgi:glycosyltransferase involved in cell wall biosynthesis